MSQSNKVPLLVNLSLFYLFVGLLSGFLTGTMNSSSIPSQLDNLHTHILMLGMFFFLIVTGLEKIFSLSSKKSLFRDFCLIYNLGLLITLVNMVLHGFETLSGSNWNYLPLISGAGHILITAGLIIFSILLVKSTKGNAEALK